MIRHVFTFAAMLTLSASAFAADAVQPPSSTSDQSLRQTAELPRDTTTDPARPSNTAIPKEREAEFEAWRADRQSALHYCFDPCIEKKPAF
jgi:hypothetical protein